MVTTRQRTTSTSLVLEMLLYFGRWYQLFYWVITLPILLYKGLFIHYTA